MPIPVNFEGEYLNEAFRVDLFVEGKVIIELRSLEKLAPVHKKQLLAYLTLIGTKLGYVLNFGVELMEDGIVRVINGALS